MTLQTEGKPNRLINAKSPYLLQHAYNPVDWYEWGEEAFERARGENKPVFLSIGYSTCHWCHIINLITVTKTGNYTGRCIKSIMVKLKLDYITTINVRLSQLE